MLENVKNLVGKKFRAQFDEWCDWLDGIGYNTYWQVMNAKDYGVPQNRERVFAVSVRKDIDDGNFRFPEKAPLDVRLKDILKGEVDKKFYLSEAQLQSMAMSSYRQKRDAIQNEVCCTLAARDYKGAKCVVVANLNHYGNDQMNRVYSTDGISPTITAVSGGGREQKIQLHNSRVRRLTPLEYWRLMGFTDEAFRKAEAVCSNSQLYKQAGNSIVVDVLVGIFKNLFRED